MDRQGLLDGVRANPNVDVLIVGGGANGMGTFRDLALNGVNVLLVEQNDFCSGTSSASSHMLHGGIRYLENGEFRLVREALHERNRMLHNAPHLSKPLRTTIPIFKVFSGFLNAPFKFIGLLNKPSERGAVVIKIGLVIYDWFTRKNRATPTHEFSSKRQSLEKYPELNPNIVSTATYYDGWMKSPERIVIEMAMDGLKGGGEQARAINYMRLEGASGDTVRLVDELSGESLDVKPKLVVNAAGPWIDMANGKMKKDTRFIGGTKGSHLIIDNPALYEATGGSEFFFENKDGRITLIFPWVDRVMMGTTDIRVDTPNSVCSDEEIEYIMSIHKHIFPNIDLKEEDIVFTFSGVRPLPNSDANTAGQISRDHSMEVIEAGEEIEFPILSLVSGKWTTFRAFSEQTADECLRRLDITRTASTRDEPIGGGRNYPKNESEQHKWVQNMSGQTGIPAERIRQLFDTYGTGAEAVARYIAAGDDRPINGLPQYSYREMMYLADHEMVSHLADVVLRRSLIAWQGQLTLTALRDIASAVADVTGWSGAETQAEIEEVVNTLLKRHRIQLHEDKNPSLVGSAEPSPA